MVVASQSKSGLSEFMLGSVATYCTQHCRRPVLVLHTPKRAAPPGAGLLNRLASVAATVLGGHPEEAAAAVAADATVQQGVGSACGVGRNIVLAVDDSGERWCWLQGRCRACWCAA